MIAKVLSASAILRPICHCIQYVFTRLYDGDIQRTMNRGTCLRKKITDWQEHLSATAVPRELFLRRGTENGQELERAAGRFCVIDDEVLRSRSSIVVDNKAYLCEHCTCMHQYRSMSCMQ